ncbi:MAG: potassium transporter TrkG, partial [Gemmatimonadales bacterium]
LGAFSAPIQWVTVVFMLVAGTNFALHYRFITGRPSILLRDQEWRWYAGLFAVSVIAALLTLAAAGRVFSSDLVRDSVFNVAAVLTTTGFATDDFAAWPAFGQVLLLGLMFVGAMGGSTGGGFKVVRAAVVFKHAVGELTKVLHPRAVVVTRLGRRTVKSDVLLNIMAFLVLYVGTHGAGSLILAALGNDLVTSVSAALAAMSSIGPGLGAVGPTAHYGDLSAPAHITLTALMLLGRLEFYTLLVLLVPETWSRWGGGR